MAQFSGERLREAREFRGLTLGETAALVGVSRQAISLFENNRKAPGAETMGQLSRALQFPIAFFLRTDDAPVRQGPLNFRKLSSATKRERAKAAVYEHWLAELAEGLLSQVELPLPNLPDFSDLEFESLSKDDLEDLAEKTRRFWGLGDGPISNLTLLLENNGVLVVRVPLAARLDGLSAWREEKPVVIVNSDAPWARGRLDVAHELAHLLLHRAVTEEDINDPQRHKLIESQAFYLGMALLFPKISFAREFYSTAMPALIELKKRWGVSIQALVTRAYHLKLISENQRMYIFRQLSINKMRTVEPLDKEIAAERPSLMRKILKFLADSGIENSRTLAERMALPLNELSHLMEMPTSDFQPLEPKIIPFKLKSVA